MKLLMHMCCAPCAVYPNKLLQDEGIAVAGLFYNPNIHPREEYDHRRQTVEQYADLTGMPVHYLDGFLQEQWERFSGEELARCTMCYTARMERVAEFARQNGYDAFTTSLLVSPYQKHDLIAELANKAGQRNGVQFYYRDFRGGFREGQQQAKEMGLYRQKFCGCIISYNERQQAIKQPKTKQL